LLFLGRRLRSGSQVLIQGLGGSRFLDLDSKQNSLPARPASHGSFAFFEPGLLVCW
jgi:hypothetical protein